jgi:hypothetical protein
LGSTAEEAIKRIERVPTLIGIARAYYAHALLRNTVLSDFSNEAQVRRQRAHEIANVLGALHMGGSDVDPQDLAIAQRYVDGEISAAAMTAAISRHRAEFANATLGNVDA